MTSVLLTFPCRTVEIISIIYSLCVDNHKCVVCFSYVCAVAVGDFCPCASTISIGASASGTTIGTTLDAAAMAGTCSGELEVSDGPLADDAPGVWFRFVGDGSNVTVSTCNRRACFNTFCSIGFNFLNIALIVSITVVHYKLLFLECPIAVYLKVVFMHRDGTRSSTF